jgi:hypothetical protein
VRFITSELKNGREIVTIDGGGEGSIISFINPDFYVQFSAANEKVCGFNWQGREVSEVIATQVILYDQADINFLAQLINSKIKVNLSDSIVSPKALDILNQMCDRFTHLQQTVVADSTIALSASGDYLTTKMKCTQIGFSVIIWV